MIRMHLLSVAEREREREGEREIGVQLESARRVKVVASLHGRDVTR